MCKLHASLHVDIETYIDNSLWEIDKFWRHKHMKLCRIILKTTRTHFSRMNGIQDICLFLFWFYKFKYIAFVLLFLRTYANWTECINFVNFIPWYQHAQVSDDDLWCNISCLRGWQGCSNNCKGSLYKDCACCVACVPLWNGKNCGHFKWKKLETGFNYILSKIV